MEKKHVLRGLATVNFYATDHEAAKKWYAEFFIAKNIVLVFFEFNQTIAMWKVCVE